jgi:hypothetical protein
MRFNGLAVKTVLVGLGYITKFATSLQQQQNDCPKN